MTTKVTDKHIGHAMRLIRIDEGISLTDLSIRASLIVPYINEIENGEHEINTFLLYIMCKALDIEIFYVYYIAAMVADYDSYFDGYHVIMASSISDLIQEERKNAH